MARINTDGKKGHSGDFFTGGNEENEGPNKGRKGPKGRVIECDVEPLVDLQPVFG